MLLSEVGISNHLIIVPSDRRPTPANRSTNLHHTDNSATMTDALPSIGSSIIPSHHRAPSPLVDSGKGASNGIPSPIPSPLLSMRKENSEPTGSGPRHVRRASAPFTPPTPTRSIMSPPVVAVAGTRSGNKDYPGSGVTSPSSLSSTGAPIIRARAFSSPTPPSPMSASYASSNSNSPPSSFANPQTVEPQPNVVAISIGPNGVNGGNSVGEYKGEHKRTFSDPFALQSYKMESPQLMLTPVDPRQQSQVSDGATVPFNPLAPATPAIGGMMASFRRTFSRNTTASPGGSPAGSPASSPVIPNRRLSLPGGLAAVNAAAKAAAVHAAKTGQGAWRCGQCLHSAVHRCIICGPLLCEEHKKKHMKESGKHKFVTDLTPSFEHLTKCKIHKAEITSRCLSHGLRCKTCEITCNQYKCLLTRLGEGDHQMHARLRRLSGNIWATLNECQRQRDFYDEREEAIKRNHTAQLEVVHNYFGRLRLALKDEENKVIAALAASHRSQEGLINTHRRAIDEVFNPALKLSSDIDGYLFEPSILDTNRPRLLRKEGENTLNILNPVIAAAPVIGNIIATPSVPALTAIAGDIPRVISINDDTISPVKCQLTGQIIESRVTEGDVTSLTIQAMDKNGLPITRGGAPISATVNATCLFDSAIPLTSTELKVIDNHDGRYTTTWTCTSPGDYTVVVKLGQWTMLGGGHKPFRVHAPPRPIKGTLVVPKIGGLGSGPGHFNKVCSVAADDFGNVWVGDAGNYRVQLIYAGSHLPAGVTTRCRGEIGAGYGQADNQFSGITVIGCDNKNVFVIDRNSFKVFTTTGALQRVTPLGHSGRGGSMCIDPYGSSQLLYITDTGANCIWVIRRDTNQLQARINNSENGELNQPSGICCAQDLLVVTDSGNNCIQCFNRSAPYEHVRTFGVIGNPAPVEAGGDLQLSRPKSIQYWANEFYVADTGNNRCVVYSFDGLYQRSFATNVEPVLTVCPTNVLVVTSVVSNSIQVFE